MIGQIQLSNTTILINLHIDLYIQKVHTKKVTCETEINNVVNRTYNVKSIEISVFSS